jgi:hypothetical protein
MSASLAGHVGREKVVRYLGALSLVAVAIPGFWFYPWRSVSRGVPVTQDRFINPSVERYAPYRQLAQSLNAQLPKNTAVLMPEIGMLGFHLDKAQVIDACGLVSPEAVQHLPVPPDLRPGPDVGVIPPDLVRETQPDLLIFLEVFGRKGVLAGEWFWENYSPVITDRGDWLPWRSEALYVFARNDFQPGLELRACSDE